MILALVLAAAPQLDFGEQGVEHPMPLPAEVLAALVEANRDDLVACEPEGPLAAYFSASPVNAELLVVTTGKYCLEGAHARPFWLFAKTARGWAQRFPAVGREIFDGFTVVPRRKGLPELVTMGHTAVEIGTTRWRFDGARYVAVKCTLEGVTHPTRRVVPCRE